MNYIDEKAIVKDNVIIGENVIIESDVYIDYGVIIKDNVHIKEGTYIGNNCIIGEYLADFFEVKKNNHHKLVIGKKSIIRSNSIIYGENEIGDFFQCGHRVTIRENSIIGNSVRIGTNCDIQDNVEIGNYVNIHSDVFISAKNIIKDYVWIFPRVLFTNDLTPPSNELIGSTVGEFSSIGAGSIILPGTIIDGDNLIGAGSIVKGRLEKGYLYIGSPCMKIKKIEEIKNKDNLKNHYPWRYNFDRGMPWENIGYKNWIANKKIKE